MAVQEDYTTGTVSIAINTRALTGVGTGWLTWGFKSGDLFYANGYVGVIESVNNNTSITLYQNFPVALTNASYRMRMMGDADRTAGKTRELIALLEGGGFFEYDASGTLAERTAYNDRKKGFSFLQVDVDPMLLYVKTSDTSGNWSPGVSFGRGPTGPVGPASTVPGPAGADGRDPGILLTWSTAITDADPGTGNIKADNASLASATMLFVDETNRAGSSIATYLAGLASSTSPIKGTLVLTSSTNTQAVFNVTAVTVATGYVKISVSGHSGVTSFANGTLISFQFARTGNAGAGSGDVTGVAVSVANRIATFTDTSGKAIKDSGKSLTDFYERSAVDALVRSVLDPTDRVSTVPILDLVMSGSEAILPDWFTRASTGTYLGNTGVLRTAAINEPRFEYDPATGELDGILIEESRTNLILNSSDFLQSVWVKARVNLTANAAVAPDGTTTATLMAEDTTATNTHQIAQAIIRPIDTASYAGIFIKKAPGGRRFVQIWTGNFANQSQRSQIIFDLDTGTGTILGNPTATADVRVQQCGNGWWRISVYTISNGVGAVTLTVSLMQDVSTVSYTGDGASGVYIWGGQWEDGLYPTSYIPTAAATVTRAGEILSLPTAPWMPDTVQGSAFIEFKQPALVPTSRHYAIGFSDNTTANFIGWSRGTGDEGLTGTPVIGAHGRSLLATFQKVAFAWDALLATSSRNGDIISQATTVRSGLIRLGIGSLTTSINYRPAILKVRRVIVFPRRLSNSDLQALTS